MIVFPVCSTALYSPIAVDNTRDMLGFSVLNGYGWLNYEGLTIPSVLASPFSVGQSCLMDAIIFSGTAVIDPIPEYRKRKYSFPIRMILPHKWIDLHHPMFRGPGGDLAE